LTKKRDDFCCIKGRMPSKIWHIPSLVEQDALYDVYKRAQCPKCKKVRGFFWQVIHNGVETDRVRIKEETERLILEERVSNTALFHQEGEPVTKRLPQRYASTASQYSKRAAKDVAQSYHYILKGVSA